MNMQKLIFTIKHGSHFTQTRLNMYVSFDIFRLGDFIAG